VITILLIVFAAVIAFGVWRRFTSVQWIWMLFGAAATLMLIWLLLLLFFIGPEMRRMGPPGG
jgi:hypothetical protein